MADDGVKYETRTVRTIRGTESRAAAKWEKAGWEVLSQSQGKLQTELTIRRPQPKTPWRLYAVGGGALAIVIIAGIIGGIIGESSDVETAGPSTDSASQTTSPPRETPFQEPTPSSAPPAEQVVLTADNNEEFAAILALGDTCDDSIAAFAEKYRGQTLAFAASIGAMANHNGYSTRYDILISAGDYSETSAWGPAFQFRDVNTTFDLHYSGNAPDTIGVGTNLLVTAEVDQYEPNSCLFLLEPVETAFR
ncbi:DUF4839 domain-containing protein [Agromyces binzhouensis]|uniref:DUF4839 domain-containing protein n=1 Tax=Agromyces binzhouensis TaxID=1817495 RepID=A0A4Q2JU12_9MICO|nr:DUF4839 domain-containing protein [Agromyces binzhouensis]RXZ51911.1 DUF4839 domain-containing protein [Agromyces binzhouensis]